MIPLSFSNIHHLFVLYIFSLLVRLIKGRKYIFVHA